MISIFTATYNRIYILNKLYDSLCKQTLKDFEWIIVDDGSTDETEIIVGQWIIDAVITINYIKQNNGGKHRAFNKGVSVAKGKLFFNVDSDDYLPSNALELIREKYLYYSNIMDIGGVAGRRVFHNGEIVGNQGFNELLSDSIEIRNKYKVTGDLVEVFELEKLKEFPFPEIENEKFCPEALIWNRFATKYKLLFFNQGVYVTEYLPDGLTAKITKIRMQSPIASMLTYRELASYNIPFLEKIKATINYWRFSFNSKVKFSEKHKNVSFYISLIALPFGYLMYKKDKKEN
jgi:glycosyltransferase involved in cell wall biosynthesis